MTSKTFKSAEYDNRELEVDVLFGNPRLLVKDFDGDSKGFIFGKATAPALALAILESAGYSEESHGLMEYAVGNLRAEVERIELEDAEAKAQAELEAEAFKLRRAYLEGRAGFDSWNELTDAERDHWLAVARKAREMAKEAINGRK